MKNAVESITSVGHLRSASGWRLVRRVASALCVMAGLTMLLPAAAAARDEDPNAEPATIQVDDPGFVDVIEVSGLLDPVLANFLSKQLDASVEAGAAAVVLRVNSTRSIIDADEFEALAAQIRDLPVTVAVWVGPGGSSARNEVAQLVGLADEVGVAPGARLGGTGDQVLPAGDFGDLWGANAARLQDATVGSEAAFAEGVATIDAPTLGDMLIGLDEFQTEVVTGEDGDPRQEPLTVVRFLKVGLIEQQFHTVASPPVAYLLFLIGGALLIFELFTAGVGVAGVIGAFCLVFASYGLSVLPTRTWAIVLLVIAFVGYAIDVQAGVPRFWSAVATIALVVGTFGLYQDVSLGWLPIIVGIGGMLLAMVNGMPAMVRTRFSTPTIGREWMIGETGEAIEEISPDGIVRIRDSLWRARTNRATPLSVGSIARVVEIDGLILEVEPEDGAARDYRDRGRSKATDE